MSENVTHADINKIKETIESGLEKLESRLMSYLDKYHEHVKDDLKQHKDWHNKHFEKADALLAKQTETKELLEKQITDSRISVIHDIAKENDKQDEVIAKLSERITIIESETRGKHSQIAMIISVIGGIAAVVAVIMAL